MTGVSQQVNTHVLDCNDAGLLGLAWWAHSEVLILKSHPAREKSSNISFENPPHLRNLTWNSNMTVQ